jgi:GT2 family glycosyltransferase
LPTQPDLSVCIVSFRCRDSLLDTLSAVERRGPSATATIEIIVVDNGSRDGTVESVRRMFPSVRVEALDTNHGLSHAANRAVEVSSGRQLLLLNPDVQVTGDTLNRGVHFLDEHPECGALGIRLRYPDGRIQGTCGHFPDTLAILARSLGIHALLAPLPRFKARENLRYFCFPAALHEVDGVLGAFLMMPRDTWERVGPLDERYFLYGEDLDWCRRARKLGIRIFYHPNLEANHAQGTSAASVPLASLRHFHRSAVRYYQNHESPGLPLVVRFIARTSLTIRFALAVARHVVGFGPAHQIYLVLRGSGAGDSPRRIAR